MKSNRDKFLSTSTCSSNSLMNGHSNNGEQSSNGTNGHYKSKSELPICYVKRRITRIVSREFTCIFTGETGSGKSTQIPQYCLEAGLADGKGIIAVTEPRKVAARALAHRVAEELGCEVGEKVGFKFRFEDKVGPSTKLAYMTDGILLRECLQDSHLSRYSVIIVDEVHERSIHTDVLLFLLKLAQGERNKKGDNPLRLFLMSATADGDKFVEYFDNAPIYHIFGRSHQVQLFASEQISMQDEGYLHNAVSAVMLLHETEPLGNGFLVFLTGQDEINAACKITTRQSKRLSNGIMALPLYSSICPLQQDKCFQPPPNHMRKVIYATNIAETSLTIPDIRVVIDTGRVKQKTFNPARGVEVMKVVKISKAQAIQRAGRAGRVANGKCYRLYSTDDYNSFADAQKPEILRSNLSSVMLNFAEMGLRRTRFLRLIDMPSAELLDAAVEELRLLGAISLADDGRFRITPIGSQLIKFPLEPKFAMILYNAKSLHCLDEALTIVSFLSTDSVFTSVESEEALTSKTSSVLESRSVFDANEGDHVRMLKIYRSYRSRSQNNKNATREWCIKHGILDRKMDEIVRIRKQLVEIAKANAYELLSCGTDYTQLRKAICRGLFLNACVFDRATASYRMHRQPKVSVKIHPSSCLARNQMNAFVFTSLVDTNETYARDISLIDEDWLADCGSGPSPSSSLSSTSRA